MSSLYHNFVPHKIVYYNVFKLVVQNLFFSIWDVSKQKKCRINGELLLCPYLFRPSDNVWRFRRADAPRCAHFSSVISPSWITEQISSVTKCALRGASSHRQRQTSFKIVTWTKQTWTKHHNTHNANILRHKT